MSTGTCPNACVYDAQGNYICKSDVNRPQYDTQRSYDRTVATEEFRGFFKTFAKDSSRKKKWWKFW